MLLLPRAMNENVSDSRESGRRTWAAIGIGALLGLAAVRRWRRSRRPDTLEGKVVLITGGSRGLGLALARAFAREGSLVVICARDPKQLRSALGDLTARGLRGVAVRCDVSRPRQVERMIRHVTERFGQIDVLVNNAGIIRVGPLDTMTLDDFREVMAVNFWGTVLPTLEVLPQMRERGDGRIVNITSIGGKISVPHLLPYGCAKFAAVGFSEGLRAELGPDGIDVTTVVPGLMRTGGPANAWFKGDAPQEFAWFSISDGTSLTATSASRAARRIVRATRDREAEVTLTWQAKLLRLFHDLFPGQVQDVLRVVNDVLPEGDGTGPPIRGMKLSTLLSPSPLTAQMNRAARDLNQYGGTPSPSKAHARRARLGPDGNDG